MGRQFSKLIVLALGSASIFMAGCSSGSSDGIAGSVGALGPNIYGQVSQSTTVSAPGVVLQRSQPGAMFAFKPGKTNKLAELAVNGCALAALDLLTNAEIANTTSGTDGTYTLKGLTAGKTYKVVANCGANEKYTSVVKADTSEIKDKDPEVTNPVSTVIAAKIIQAVLTAVESLGLTGDTAAAVKAAVVANMDSIISVLKSTIEAAIQSGAMQPPTVAESAVIAGGLQTTTTAAQANSSTTAYETAKPIPAAVNDSVEGAKSQVAAFADCDNTLAGKSVTTCTRAVAKIIYSGLTFPLLLNISGGAFAAELASGCDMSNNPLKALFPNADIQDAFGLGISGFCLIKPRIAATNRNRGDERGGDDHDMVFTETGALGSGNDGVITALGEALFNKFTYRLANIDKIMFDYNTINDSGMNARLFHMSRLVGSGGDLSASTVKFKNSGGTWTAVSSITWQDSSISYCDNPFTCDVLPNPNNGNGGLFIPFKGTAVQWTPSELSNDIGMGSTALGALVTAIGAGSNAGTTGKIYGGNVPSMPQIDAFVNKQSHIDHNPSGNRKNFVIYGEGVRQDPGTGMNPCYDLTSTASCIGISGAEYPAVRVNIGLGSTISPSNPIRAITSVVTSATGEYLMRPYFDRSGFTGLVGFTKVSDGRTLTDELNRERAIKVSLTSNDCSPPPFLGISCAPGQMFNAKLDWSTCGQGGSNCPGWEQLSAQIATPSGTPNFAAMITTEVSMTGVMFGGANHQVWVAATGDYAYRNPLRVSIPSPTAGSDSLTEAMNGGYFLVPRYTGCPSACTIQDYYLINDSGAVRLFASDSNATHATAGVCGIVNSNFTCTGIDAVTYTTTYVNGLNFTGGTFAQIATNKRIFNGPYVNPSFRCDKEPFFLDGNNNGLLDCDTANPTQVLTSSGDISFASANVYQQWYTMPGNNSPLRNTPLRSRDNGYVFGDPAGAKKLLTTAFNGWFDGAHTIAADTSLNALQVFGLVFLTFSREGGLSMDTSGTGLPDGHFTLQMPSDSSAEDVGAGKVVNINNLLGGGLLNLKYTAP